MKKAHLKHLNKILKDFEFKARDKYQRGVEEHGGNLWEKNVLAELEDEIIDLIIYYYTLKQQIGKKYEYANKKQD